MIFQKFEDIIAWQKAQDLAVIIYTTFKEIKDYSFRDQICRATVSISNNIAEGFDRNSDAEFARFLHIAISSASETRSMIYLANRLGYINNNEKEELIIKSSEVSMIIRGLIKSLK